LAKYDGPYGPKHLAFIDLKDGHLMRLAVKHMPVLQSNLLFVFNVYRASVEH
jgi:hypothetical protein